MEARAKRREMAQLEFFAGTEGWGPGADVQTLKDPEGKVSPSPFSAEALPGTELARHPPTASRPGACTGRRGRGTLWIQLKCLKVRGSCGVMCYVTL